MLPNEKLRFEELTKNDEKIVCLKGTIDEDSNFTSLAKIQGPLCLDFSGVTAINSCGIRSWVNFLKQMSDNEIKYIACPPLIVRQMNMVPSFVGRAHVTSVFVPYVCEHCDAEKNVLINESDFKDGKISISMPCDICKKGEMEFDGQPKQYFAFSRG